MTRLAKIAVLGALSLTALGASTASEPAKLPAVVSITLPGDLTYAYKKGPGQEVAQSVCLTCHSSAYVSMQAPMDAAAWTKEVTKMRKAYGASMTDAQATAVADYLGREYGPPAH